MILMLVFNCPAIGCECGRPGPACAYVGRAKAVFVGKVDFTDDDGSGTFLQKTSVRFEVEESFKGLASDMRYVWIDPGSFTSCYAEYHIGERYLVFAYGGGVMPPDTATMSIGAKGRPKKKPLPPGIDPKNPPMVYSSAECTGTRQITAENERFVLPEIEYLRKFKAGTALPMVTGRVTQDDDFGIFDPPGLAGAKVMITGKNVQRSLETDIDGRYVFEGVAPGSYTVSSAMAAYRPTRNAVKVEVAGVGCGFADFDMIGTGVIEGKLLDHDGRPASGVKLKILRLGPDLKPIFYGFKESRSDAQGKYRFEKLPSGDFEIGVNLSSAPDLETPFPPTKWSDDGQSRIHLNPGQHQQVTTLKLPTPSQVRVFPVEVRWPDGRAAADVDVWAEVGDNVGAHGQTDANGRTRLDLLEGVTYSVEAKIWVKDDGRKEVARSGAIQLTPGPETNQLNLQLNRRTKVYR